jgi:hypothetical protein
MVQDCPRCGLANPPEAQRCDCGYDFTARRMGRPPGGPRPPSATNPLGEVLRVKKVLGLACTGVACLALGTCLISQPMYWTDPKGPGLTDLLAGGGAILAGLGAFGLLIYMVRKAK